MNIPEQCLADFEKTFADMWTESSPLNGKTACLMEVESIKSYILSVYTPRLLKVVKEKVLLSKDLGETVVQNEDWKEGGRYAYNEVLAMLS
jgi:hypothetical protein